MPGFVWQQQVAIDDGACLWCGRVVGGRSEAALLLLLLLLVVGSWWRGRPGKECVRVVVGRVTLRTELLCRTLFRWWNAI